MTTQYIPGSAACTLPDVWPFTRAATGFANSSALVIDFTGEQVIVTGRVMWSDRGSHKISSAGGKIGWRTGAVVWASALTAVTVGIQDTSTAAGPPARGDGTFDVSATLVQGVDTIAPNTFYETAMTSGTKTIATGDLISVVIEMTLANGIDSVGVSSSAALAGVPSPEVTTYLSGTTYSTQNVFANLTLIADDGTTYGTFVGAFAFATVGTTTGAFNNGSSPREYGNLFSLPYPCAITGVWGLYSDGNNVSSSDISLYTDPLNAGAGVTAVAVTTQASRSGAGSALNGLAQWIFATPYSYTANTLMAMAVQPTAANSISLVYFEVNTANAWNTHPLGTQCYAVNRNTISSGTAFGTYGSTSRRMCMGLIVGGYSDGTGGGVLVHPGTVGGAHG